MCWLLGTGKCCSATPEVWEENLSVGTAPDAGALQLHFYV